MPDTFIAKRWHLPKSGYVDSKNNKIESVYQHFPQWLGEPSIPTEDGSAPFLSLPTELRLQIYSYLTNEDVVGTEEFARVFGATPSGPTTTFAYLYRSPGRVTKPRSISKQVIDLFHVCRRMRVELIDACFSDRTFVLEASLYQRDAGGLFALPANPGPTAWITKLALFTIVEGNGLVKGIGDIRPLQQMVNLKVLYIAFQYVNARRMRGQINGRLDVHARPDNVLKALLECVPKDCEVHPQFGPILNRTFTTEFKDLEFYTDLKDLDANDVENRKALLDDLVQSKSLQGKLSGSIVNHAHCEYDRCIEGLDCVNSHCKIPVKPYSEADVQEAMRQKEIERKANEEWKDGVMTSFEEITADGAIDRLMLGAASSHSRADKVPKKCIHGNYVCRVCEKGLIQKLKVWSGHVYRY